MKRETITLMINGLADDYIREAEAFCPDAVQKGRNRFTGRKKKRILTLALAAALILGLGAVGFSGHAFFGWGGNMEIRATKTDSGLETTVLVHTDSLTEPVTSENDRMYFVVDNQHLDITDLVSETQPFLYQYTDEENTVHYWIIGKNGPELTHYGYAEYLRPSGGEWTVGYVARTNNNEAPWLDRAKEELGFDF